MKFDAGWRRYEGEALMTRRDVDEADIQAIVRSGFRSLRGASYLLLRVIDAPAARRWLGGLKPAAVADLGLGHIEQTIQIAFTAAGLRALGVTDEIVQRFAPEFVEGLVGSENRSQRLGDIGANAPVYWDWGVGDREPHVLVMLFTSTPSRIEAFASEHCGEASRHGFTILKILQTSDMGDVEPFGFRDSISQPAFDWDRVRTPGTKADRLYTNLIALGEVLLGYRNEYGYPAESPALRPDEKDAKLLPMRSSVPELYDLGRNGSYLVYRQLAQDVRGFWKWMLKEGQRTNVAPEALAEAVVGRRLDGRPLGNLEVGRQLPGVDPDELDLNGFLFDVDPDGLSCPIGAHIRRANPRTGDVPPGEDGPFDHLLVTLGLTVRRDRRPTSSTVPWPRNTTVWPFLRSQDDAIASARFHRILRRGREYGRELDKAAAIDPATPDPQAGLHFLCLNSNITRQFEFVQGAWIASAKFAGLSGEQDPLLGNREAFPDAPVTEAPQLTNGFTRPSAEPHCRRARDIPQFVYVRGGAYFFLPGLAALKWIAAD
jgi:deferrochelatase/peroxidase EfeB